MKSLDAILIKPVLTEKMLQMQEKTQKYGFQVASQANKIEIKKAIEGKFGVLVDKVHTVTSKVR